MITVADLIEELNDIAPPDLADDDDRIGLQVGNPSAEVKRICVSVDTLGPVVDTAISKGADLLVSHHPLIYTPLKTVSETDPVVGGRVVKMIRANMALFVMHTNYDTVPGGVNDALASRLGITGLTPLTSRKQDTFYKIVVFVPEEAVEDVRNAMADAGAGVIGQYSHCSFRTKGIGSFVPLPHARPYIGTEGRLEEVEEYRLEMVCAGSWVNYALAAMLEKHPYDEVAYDLYELANEPVVYGYGRVGYLEEKTTLKEFSERVKQALGLEYVKVAGDPNAPVLKIALCGGAGGSLFKDAVETGADVYLTGDVSHHTALEALELGLPTIDATHFATEKPGMVDLTERLKKTFEGGGLEIEYIE